MNTKLISRYIDRSFFYSRTLKIYLLPILVIIYTISIPAWATIYHVDAATGLDSNNGIAPSTAWKTISKVNNASLSPGDQVLFNRGQVWREGLDIPASGTEGNPITFGAYGQGANPIINASDLVGNWTIYQGTTYRSRLATETNRVFYGGLELTRGTNQETLEINMWHWVGGYLYVNIGTNPAGRSIEATQRDYAVKTNGRSNIILANLHLIYNNKKSSGVLYFYPSGSMNFTVNNNTIEYGFGDGVRAEVTGGDNLVFSNNIVRYNKMWGISAGSRLSTGHSYMNNTVYQNGESGFLITVQNSKFAHNIIYGTPESNRGDGIPTHGLYVYNWKNGGDGSIIEYNEVYGFNDPRDGDSALRLSGSNCTVRYNYFHDNDYGIYLIDDETVTDSNDIYYNVISGLNGEHSGIEIEGATNTIIYNNTIVGSGIVFVKGVNGNSYNNFVKNNIIAAGTQGVALQIEAGQESGFQSNHNLFYPATGKRFLWSGSNLTFDDWIKISKNDQNSIVGDPLFVGGAPIDKQRFSLASGSPAIGTGEFLGLTQDIDGTVLTNNDSPDVGSFQTE